MGTYSEHEIQAVNLIMTDGLKRFIAKAYMKYYGETPPSKDYGTAFLTLLNSPLSIFELQEFLDTLEKNNKLSDEKKMINDRYIGKVQKALFNKIIVQHAIEAFMKETDIKIQGENGIELDRLRAENKTDEVAKAVAAQNLIRLAQEQDNQIKSVQQQKMLDDLSARQSALEDRKNDINNKIDFALNKNVNTFVSESHDFKLPNGKGLLDGVDIKAYTEAKRQHLQAATEVTKLESERESLIELKSSILEQNKNILTEAQKIDPDVNPYDIDEYSANLVRLKSTSIKIDSIEKQLVEARKVEQQKEDNLHALTNTHKGTEHHEHAKAHHAEHRERHVSSIKGHTQDLSSTGRNLELVDQAKISISTNQIISGHGLSQLESMLNKAPVVNGKPVAAHEVVAVKSNSVTHGFNLKKEQGTGRLAQEAQKDIQQLHKAETQIDAQQAKVEASYSSKFDKVSDEMVFTDDNELASIDGSSPNPTDSSSNETAIKQVPNEKEKEQEPETRRKNRI